MFDTKNDYFTSFEMRYCVEDLEDNTVESFQTAEEAFSWVGIWHRNSTPNAAPLKMYTGVYGRLTDGRLMHIADQKGPDDSKEVLSWLTTALDAAEHRGFVDGRDEESAESISEDLADAMLSVWEEMIKLRSQHNDKEQAIEKITLLQHMWNEEGWSAMRLKAQRVGRIVEDAWLALSDDERDGIGSFDWDFVPDFLSTFDWNEVA